MKPFCFVLMPFGRKKDAGGREIDFDAVYEGIIRPAVADTGLDAIRADEEKAGGMIHKPMFERLMLCDYAVADLTGANANVFYELGVRHGIRPHATVLMFTQGMQLPFDVQGLRGLPYALDANGRPAAAEADRAALARRLRDCRDQVPDSPLYQLVTDFSPPDLARLKTDLFRERVAYARTYRDRLADARTAGVGAVVAVEAELVLGDADPAVVVDLFLSYRAVEAWQRMVDLVPKMAPELQRTPMVREQLAFALNRLGRRDAAQGLLEELIAERGPSSETNGLLGRIHKDRWEEARDAGRASAAAGHLRRAVATYLAGFEADWRDAYPGVNAVTLMEMLDPVDPRQAELLPVVRYAVMRRLAGKAPDYWDHATLLELAVLADEPDKARSALADAASAVREVWEPRTTARNLRLIREVRTARGRDAAWIQTIEDDLERAATDKGRGA